MRFSDFILLETQTIAQALKANTAHTPQEIQQIKTNVRQQISGFPFFQTQGRKYLDLFVNFFSFMQLPSYGLTGYRSNVVNTNWQQWGDYIVAHVNDNRIMSQFNTIDLTADQINQQVQNWHEELKLRQSRPGGAGRPILDVGGGWQWLSLDKNYCDQEGAAAGHCGNVAYKPGDNIFSLRDPQNRVHLTFIVNNKILGESKGRGNSKPVAKYHPAIVKLLLSPYIDLIRGGGYLADNNFALTDLDKTTLESLLKQKPILGMNYFDYLIQNLKDDDLKQKFVELLGFPIVGVQGNKLLLKEFTNFEDIDYFLKYTDETSDEVGWLDNIKVNDVQDYIDSAVNYLAPDLEKALEKYFANQGRETEEEELSLADKIEQDEEVHQAIVSAYTFGMEVGISDEAWDDIKGQLGNKDKNGYWIDFDHHPWTLCILLSSLKSLFVKYEVETNGKWLEDSVKLNYRSPRNGYQDFSEKAFNDQLRDNLPPKVLKYLPKSESFVHWFSKRIASNFAMK